MTTATPAEQGAPQRTCVGCRQRGARGELLRWVARIEGDVARIERDPDATATGRGAWLHDDPACLETAVRRNAFRRALRIPPGIRAELAGATATGGGAALARTGIQQRSNGM